VGEHPYVYLDGIVLKRSWAGEVRNVSLLVAIGVNEDGWLERIPQASQGPSVRRRISRRMRSSGLLVRIRRQCSSGKA